jgi:branched-chain amino acid transport system substrate-binding protein
VAQAENLPWFYKGSEMKDFHAAMDQFGGGSANKEAQQASSSVTWTGLEMFKKALANAPDTVTSQTVIDGLYAIKDETLGGLLPKPYTYQKSMPHALVPCAFVFTIRNGAYEMIQGTTPLCVAD